MKIIIAPDSYKGSISAVDCAGIIAAAYGTVFPNADIMQMPLADGGEGSLDCILNAVGGKRYTFTVADPVWKKINADCAVLNNDTGIIELAQASGLTLLKDEERNPHLTTTYGTGELIRHLLDEGCRKFIICLGGSATNDGGTGIICALGAILTDKNGNGLSPCGESLSQIDSINLELFDRRVYESKFTVLCDVTNPLTGKNGAAAVFGPQKGADLSMTAELDAGLSVYGDVIYKMTGTNYAGIAGSGAAGGAATALLAFFNAELRSGINEIIRIYNFQEELENTQLVITGEGKLDAQTLGGKAVSGIAFAAKNAGVPVLALCGSVDGSRELIYNAGVTAAVSISEGPARLEDMIFDAKRLLHEAALATAKLVKISL